LLIVYSNVFKILLISAPSAVKVTGDCQWGFGCSRWSAEIYPEFASFIHSFYSVPCDISITSL